MLDTYFSWLEYVLVFILTLTGFDLAKGALVRFVGSTRDGEFKEVFNVSDNVEAKRVYDQLKQIKESIPFLTEDSRKEVDFPSSMLNTLVRYRPY